jgi:cyanophycinase
MGLLVLNGGDEFNPGNDEQDRLLVAAAGSGPAYVVPTAAARQHPEAAVRTAQRWFAKLGLQVQPLNILSRSDANSQELAARAAEAGFLYLTGGDPGHVAGVLGGSAVWSAMVEAWRAGAPLAGSSAGAMALCEWSLVIAKWPRHGTRRPVPALNLVPAVAVLPHYDTFGHKWLVQDPPSGLFLVGPDERTAAVWDPATAAWTVAGAGKVTLIPPAGAARVFANRQVIEGLPPPLNS